MKTCVAPITTIHRTRFCNNQSHPERNLIYVESTHTGEAICSAVTLPGVWPSQLINTYHDRQFPLMVWDSFLRCRKSMGDGRLKRQLVATFSACNRLCTDGSVRISPLASPRFRIASRIRPKSAAILPEGPNVQPRLCRVCEEDRQVAAEFFNGHTDGSVECWRSSESDHTGIEVWSRHGSDILPSLALVVPGVCRSSKKKGLSESPFQFSISRREAFEGSNTKAP
jgi:hypothetical protein